MERLPQRTWAVGGQNNLSVNVTAYSYEITYSGALLFFDREHRIKAGFNTGTWVTIRELVEG